MHLEELTPFQVAQAVQSSCSRSLMPIFLHLLFLLLWLSQTWVWGAQMEAVLQVSCASPQYLDAQQACMQFLWVQSAQPFGSSHCVYCILRPKRLQHAS
jgi:hypothetical protein